MQHAILSILLPGKMHNIAFYAFLKILTNGKIRQEQAQAIFEHLDLGMICDSKSLIHFLEVNF
jgi:hypothetical protein